MRGMARESTSRILRPPLRDPMRCQRWTRRLREQTFKLLELKSGYCDQLPSKARRTLCYTLFANIPGTLEIRCLHVRTRFDWISEWSAECAIIAMACSFRRHCSSNFQIESFNEKFSTKKHAGLLSFDGAWNKRKFEDFPYMTLVASKFSIRNGATAS